MRNLISHRLQSMRKARWRLASVTFCARTFQKPARYFCYCPTGLSRGAGWGAPLRGVLVVCATLERLCDCVLACCVLRAWARSYDRGYIVAVVVSWVIARRGRPGVAACLSGRGCGGRVAFLCRCVVVATRRESGVVLRFWRGVVCLDLRNNFIACTVIAMSTGWPVGLATSALSLRGHGKTVDG